jgi:hypothetical protein
MTLEFIAIKKKNKYFVRHKSERYFSFESLIFNTEQLKSFSDQWLIFTELPTEIKKRIREVSRVVKYNLKEGFAESTLTPLTMPADAFDYVDEGNERVQKNSHIAALYKPETIDIPDRFETVQFTLDIIDEDCEPLVDPKYVFRTEFPYFIENHSAVHHKYPCYITPEDLFKTIRAWVKKNLPEHCRISSDYDFHLQVELIMPLLHEETIKVDVARHNARKRKFEERPLRSIAFKIIDICTPGNNYGTVLQKIEGKNYADLESKIDALLEEYRKAMEKHLAVCSHCKGYGFFEETGQQNIEDNHQKVRDYLCLLVTKELDYLIKNNIFTDDVQAIQSAIIHIASDERAREKLVRAPLKKWQEENS